MVLLGLVAFVMIVAALAWWLSRTRDFWNRFAVAGFLLVPLALVVQSAAGNLTGVLGTPIPLTAACLVVAVVLLTTKRFYFPAFVVALLAFLLFGLFGLFGLTHADSFGDFAPAVMSVGGLALALVGTFKASRKHRDTAPAPAPQRAASVWTAAGILAAIAATSALRTVTESAAQTPGGAQLVVMHRDSFEPDVLRVSAGRPVTILVRNEDSYAHTFAIDEADMDVYVGPFRDKRITFTLPADVLTRGSGSKLEFVCTVTGHDDMRGTLEVVR